MKRLKVTMVLLALLASLLGGSLVGVPAPHGPFPLPMLQQAAVHQFLANGGSGAGGDPGNG
jgi:hypothetical protein